MLHAYTYIVEVYCDNELVDGNPGLELFNIHSNLGNSYGLAILSLAGQGCSLQVDVSALAPHNRPTTASQQRLRTPEIMSRPVSDPDWLSRFHVQQQLIGCGSRALESCARLLLFLSNPFFLFNKHVTNR